MVINDNEIEKFVFTQMAYRESAQRNALTRPIPIEAEISRACILADAKVSEKGFHYSS